MVKGESNFSDRDLNFIRKRVIKSSTHWEIVWRSKATSVKNKRNKLCLQGLLRERRRHPEVIKS